MSSKTILYVNTALLAILGISLAEKYITGKLYFYIGQRFGWLTLLAIGLLALMVIVSLGIQIFAGRRSRAYQDSHHGPDHGHEHGNEHTHDHNAPSLLPQVAFGILVLLSVAVPARPLGASAIANRGIAMDVAIASDQQNKLTIVPGKRNILDWARIISTTTNPSVLDGQEADVVGFVYRDVRFADDQFMVARFTITCCVADALAIGVVVVDKNATALKDAAWVQVRGTFSVGELDGETMPILIAEQITPIEEPEQPYLYP